MKTKQTKPIEYKINKLIYTYIEEYDFWRIDYEMDGVRHVVNLSSHIIEGLDMSAPDAVAYLLRATIDCEPRTGERHVRPTVDE